MMENKTKIDLKNKSIFITGVAGFIGSNLAKRLLSTVEGVKVVGLDNMNNYYDVRLKEARLKELEQFEKFSFIKGNLADKAVIESIFEQYKPEIVVTARILGLALVEVVTCTGLFVAQLRRGKTLYVKKYWVHALHFNLPLIPHYLSQTVLNSSDRIMIQKMVSADAAGIYSLAYSISQIMTIFNTALLKTIEPWLYKKMKANRTQDIGRVAYLSLGLVAAVNLILIVLAPEAVAIFAPVQYHEAIWVIPPVAMGVYFMFAYTFFAVIEFYFEKTKYVTYATMSGAVLNIILNYICIKLFGYMAAGYTTLVCYMLYTVAHYCFAQKICNEEMNGVRIYNLKTLLTITGAFMISGFLLMMTYNAPVIRYGLLVIAGVLAVLNRNKIIALLKSLIAMKKA